MSAKNLVFGLLDNSRAIGDATVAEKYRDLTISWSRYGYRGKILEAASVDEILAIAGADGYRYCFIQSYGHVISEKWRMGPAGKRDFHAALAELVESREFLVMGRLEGDGQRWYGVREDGLIVDLKRYAETGSPAFDGATSERTLPDPDVDWRGDRPGTLTPTERTARVAPGLRGWPLVAASLTHGLPVLDTSELMGEFVHDLAPEAPGSTSHMGHLLGRELSTLDERKAALAPGQRDFLETVERQATNARQGVFLWNIEAYDDVETPPAGFASPVSTLYSVCSGFKPYRILETHGMDERSRIVFFDYSDRALEIRRFMLEHWDGRDFPQFCRRIFEAFPPPDTFYQLWTQACPPDVSWETVEQAWQRELYRWGGARAFAESWARSRALDHTFVRCDILTEAPLLLEHMTAAGGTVVWWSNAFFTMYSNWLRTLEERALAYRSWVEALAARAPNIYVYGSDDANANVNGVSASDYLERFRQAKSNPLEPAGVFRTEIRM